MERNDNRAQLITWLSNLRATRQTHFKEGARWDAGPIRYFDGAIEAYQRVLDTIGEPSSSRRTKILELVASEPRAAFPGWARWENNGISYQDVNDLWCYPELVGDNRLRHQSAL